MELFASGFPIFELTEEQMKNLSTGIEGRKYIEPRIKKV